MGSKEYGVNAQQLMPKVIERRAEVDPDGVFAKVPVVPTSYASGFRSVTNLEVLHAIDRLAWLFEKGLGKGHGFPTIAYMGPGDLRYVIVLMASIKTGYQVFLPSPRNSKAAFNSLLSRLNCKVMLATQPEVPSVPMILKDYHMKLLGIPSLGELLEPYDGPLYPYDKLYEVAKHDPIFVLHTSGSTGIPKPMFYTHEIVSRMVNTNRVTPTEGCQILNRLICTGTFFSALPAFHVAGIGFAILVPVFTGCVPVLPIAGPPPTTQGLLDALNTDTKMDWAFLAPVTIESLAKDEESLKLVASKLQYLCYVGGSVPQTSGDIVAANIALNQVFGSSECGAYPLLQPGDYSGRDWNSVQLHPLAGAQFRHRFDNLHELVFVRHKDSELQSWQPVFAQFPDLEEYETRDLFCRHPTKPNRWIHQSRMDDVIVFVNGEKTNPVSMEQEIARHPEVLSALVAGQQRFEASLLVELVDGKYPNTPQERFATVERIWPTVQQANSVTPAHARVSKSKILLVDPAMPMPRAGKGTVQRQETWKVYAEKLNALYAAEDDIPDIYTKGVRDGTDLTDRSAVAAIIRSVSEKLMERNDDFKDSDDFFALGMDSLMVLRLSRELKSRLAVADLDPKIIYANPSVDLLTDEIMRIALHSQTINGDSKQTSRQETLAALMKNYEKKIDKLTAAAAPKANESTPFDATDSTSDSQVVILTGSTGGVGSYILEELLQNKFVIHIYCLNRSTNSESLQKTRNAGRGLSTSFPSDRVTFLAADLSKTDDLGLDKSSLNTILSSTTQIIHNAWPVDFNRSLLSFASSLDSVITLISLASRSKLSPSILFLSSISSIANYSSIANAQTLVPESIISDLSCPAAMGYGESKYVAERILDYGSRQLGLNTASVRVGQVGGTAESPRGWNRNEWLPSLVISSKYIGAVPESLGTRTLTGGGVGAAMMDEIDWIPIDRLAAILIELTFDLRQSRQSSGSEGRGSKVFHARNPGLTSWSDLLPVVKSSIESTLTSSSYKTAHDNGKEVKVVNFSDWLDLLRSSSQDNTEGKTDEDLLWSNPGIKLLDFYSSLVGDDGGPLTRTQMDLQHTKKISQSLQKLEAVRPEWMQGWVKGWIGQER